MSVVDRSTDDSDLNINYQKGTLAVKVERSRDEVVISLFASGIHSYLRG